MDKVPFEISGIYYRPIKDHFLNSSKVNKIWNIVSNRPEYNQPLFDVIFFGKLDNRFGDFKPQNLNKLYFAEITFNFVLKDFFEYARKNSGFTHKKYTDYQNELSFHHLKIDGSNIEFQNQLWKCNGYFRGDELSLNVENLRDGNKARKQFNYFR